MTAEQMAVRLAEQDERDARAIESAWDKIDSKVRFAKWKKNKTQRIDFTLLELQMLQQFRRKFA